MKGLGFDRNHRLSTFFILVLGLSCAFAAPAGAYDLTAVTLTWTAPGDDMHSGQATIYDIRYATDSITAVNWNNAIQASGEPTPQPAGSPETFTISGLEPSTKYYFALKTADEKGNWSSISNIAVVVTEDTIAPAAVNDLAVSIAITINLELKAK